jgi:hypothetical protein
MKRELEKKIRAICDEIGTAAATEACDSITEELKSKYDKLINDGMYELDAYRDVLQNIDEIKKALDALPKSKSETDAIEEKARLKSLKNILGKISTVMWISIVIMFFYVSFTTGMWHISWLIFIWGAICQTVLDMVLKYNKGKPLKKVLSRGLSTILWNIAVIVYFLVSFATGKWAITWIIFLISALLQKLVGWIIEK